MLSMLGAGDLNNTQMLRAAIFSGIMTFLVQFKELLPPNEEAKTFSPLLMVTEKKL